jgi:hypothetical protein
MRTDDDIAGAMLTKDEYREWVRLVGTPLCGALTAAGRPCRKAAGSYRSSADA